MPFTTISGSKPARTHSSSVTARPFDRRENTANGELYLPVPVSAASPEIRMEKFSISALLRGGEISDFDHEAPAHLEFSRMCSRFARGTLITTKNGLVAIEDLRPGELIKTKDDGFQPLGWVGSCLLRPMDDTAEIERPVRFKTDVLGYGRPMQDLIVSQHFRMLLNHPTCVSLFGWQEMLAPAAEMVNGDTILPIYATEEILFFNVMFDKHQIIEVNGIETESYHLGDISHAGYLPEKRLHLRKMLPHLEGDYKGFGKPVRPYLKAFEAAMLRAG